MEEEILLEVCERKISAVEVRPQIKNSLFRLVSDNTDQRQDGGSREWRGECLI